MLVMTIWLELCTSCSSSRHRHLRPPGSSKIRNGDILVLTYPGCPGKWWLNKCCLLFIYRRKTRFAGGVRQHASRNLGTSEVFTGHVSKLQRLKHNQRSRIHAASFYRTIPTTSHRIICESDKTKLERDRISSYRSFSHQPQWPRRSVCCSQNCAIGKITSMQKLTCSLNYH